MATTEGALRVDESDEALHRAMALEVAECRLRYVNGVVGRKVDAREGNFTNAEYEAWEADAYRWWREHYPNLNNLLIPHGSVGSTSVAVTAAHPEIGTQR